MLFWERPLALARRVEARAEKTIVDGEEMERRRGGGEEGKRGRERKIKQI